MLKMNELIRRLQADIEQGLSRRQIADKAGVSEGTIRKLLDGHQAKHEVYQRLADNYFRLPVDEVYRMAGILPSMYSPDGRLNRDWMLSKLWDVLNRLPESGQALVMAEAMRLLEEQRKRDNQTKD